MSGARQLATSLGVAAALVLGTGCSDDPTTADEEPLWPADFETAFSEVRDCRLSPAAHDGFYIRVFANPAAADAYVDGNYPLPEGTLLVKGEYDESTCDTLVRVSTMQKLPDGAAPSTGDWRWQRTDADGTPIDDVPMRSCAGCHAACESTDYACTDP